MHATQLQPATQGPTAQLTAPNKPQVVLRVLGLVLVYTSTWTLWPLAATAMGLLLTTVIGPGVVRCVCECVCSVFLRVLGGGIGPSC